MIDENSLDAFESIKPDLNAKQRIVFEALRNKPATNKTLSKRMQLPINSITPRVLELRKMGLVKKMYSEIDNNRTATVWGVCL